MPGETIRLPSLGMFYKNGELADDVVNGEIILHPMTMTDEIMMKSPDMLFQGTAIDTVFRRCGQQIKRPLDLLTADVDFILTHLRRISFGPYIDVKFTCQNPKGGEVTVKGKGKNEITHVANCGHEQEARVQLEYFTNESKEIDPSDIETTFTVLTESDNRTVKLKPITFQEFLIMQQTSPESLNDPETLRTYILDSVLAIIESVDAIRNDTKENREFIREWLDTLPRADTQLIMDKIKDIQDWGPSFNYKVACTKCGHVNELSTELNPTAFFIRPSSPKTQP